MMADITGTVRARHDGRVYEMRLTMRSLAVLQDKHGDNIAGLLDGSAGSTPNLTALIDMVSLALQKGSGMAASDADDVADELLTADVGIIEKVIRATFPNATVEGARGNGRKPKAA